MPNVANLVKTQDYINLKRALEWNPDDGVDRIFEADENFGFGEVRSNTDLHKGKWYGVKVWLYNFIIGKATPGNDPDDPQLVGLCKCPRPHLVQMPELTDLAERTPKFAEQIFGAYHPLSCDEPVRFGVFCNAFENDTTKAWDKIVDALSGDLKSAITLGINALPALNQYATPQAVGAALSSLVQQGLTPSPDIISGDDIICDTVNAVHWFRKIDKQSWIARKWHIFTLENEQAWYLTQWFIELSTIIRLYDYAALPPTPHFNALYASLTENIQVTNTDLAALLVLKGNDRKLIAEKYGLGEEAISIAINALSKAPKDEFNARIQAALVQSLENKLL